MRTVFMHLFHRKVLFGVILVSLLVFICSKNTQTFATPTLPNFDFPFTGDQVYWTSGPHQWGNWNFGGTYPKGLGSGLDFAGGAFTVRAMAPGTVLYRGWGQLGNQIVVQLDDSTAEIIYGHLSSFIGVSSHLNTGDAIGIAGNTTPNPPMGIHLHVELRDGATECTNSSNCGTAVGWDGGVKIGSYYIYGVEAPSANPQMMYNYDGSAIFDNGIAPIKLTKFSFVDNDQNHSVRLGQVFVSRAYSCPYTTQTCADNSLEANTKFAIGDETNLIGGGGVSAILVSNTQSNSTPTPIPGGQTGNSSVDIFENTNYSATQYGWDSATNGWVNVPDYLNDKTSSVQIDGGWSILVAKDNNGAGTNKCLVSSYADLSGAYYDNGDPMTDTISSVSVFQDNSCGGSYIGTKPGDTVTFWVDPNYWNTNWGVHDPFSGDLPNYLQNAVTSIGVTPGWSAVVYRNPSLGDGFICFTGSDSDLTNNVMNDGYPVNDNIDSIEIFHDSNCGGRMHPPTVGAFNAQVSSYHVLLTYNISGMAPGYSIHTDFGDGASFDMTGPAVNVPVTHDYAWGSYLIVITIKGTDGASYPYSTAVTVSPPPTPTPVPTVTPTPTPIPTSVTTTVNSFNPNTGVLSYTLNWTGIVNNWNQCVFGDGPTQHVEYFGPQVNKVDGHAYPVGNYTFTCTVVGLNNNKYVQSRLNTMVGAGKPITQLPLITVNAMVQPNRTVVFTVVTANAKNVNHVLAYGSGQGSVNAYGNGTKTFSKSYPAAGTYNVTMTVYGLNNVTYVLNQQLVIQ